MTGWDGKVWSATSIWLWQHIKLSEQIRPGDTLACCWDVKQPTNKQTVDRLSIHSTDYSEIAIFHYVPFFRYFWPDPFSAEQFPVSRYSLFSPISSFSFWTFCLFLCSFSVRQHAHVDFQLFSQKSSGIPDYYLACRSRAQWQEYCTTLVEGRWGWCHTQWNSMRLTFSCPTFVSPLALFHTTGYLSSRARWVCVTVFGGFADCGGGENMQDCIHGRKSVWVISLTSSWNWIRFETL